MAHFRLFMRERSDERMADRSETLRSGTGYAEVRTVVACIRIPPPTRADGPRYDIRIASWSQAA